MKRVERPQLKIAGHFVEIDGRLVEIDPVKTDLPARCKLIWAEAMTGNKYELIYSSTDSSS
jgi:hypothetical protein